MAINEDNVTRTSTDANGLGGEGWIKDRTLKQEAHSRREWYTNWTFEPAKWNPVAMHHDTAMVTSHQFR